MHEYNQCNDIIIFDDKTVHFLLDSHFFFFATFGYPPTDLITNYCVALYTQQDLPVHSFYTFFA